MESATFSPHIWTYWRSPPGESMPTCYQLCWETIQRHNPTATLVTPEMLQDLGLSEALQAAEGLPIAIESDLVRAALLARFGGLWVDLDTICFGPCRLPAAAKTAPATVVRNPRWRGFSKRYTFASPFYLPPESSIAVQLLAAVYQHVAAMRRGQHVPWGTTSCGALSQIARRTPGVYRLGHLWWHPHPWRLARQIFLRRGNREQRVAEFFRGLAPCVLCHLSNPIPGHFHGWTREAILASDTYVAALLRIALQLPPEIPPRTLSILDRIPQTGIWSLAEIGVFRGVNAAWMLQQRPDLQLTAVDPWQVADDDYRQTGDYQTRFTQAQWDAVAADAADRWRFASDRVTVLRQRSTDAVAQIPDRSLDAVWIDANHSAAAVSADLEAWLPKVRYGGWIGGHDYHHRRDASGQYGVTAAVDALALVKRLTIETGRDTTWFCDLRR